MARRDFGGLESSAQLATPRSVMSRSRSEKEGETDLKMTRSTNDLEKPVEEERVSAQRGEG